MGLKRITKPIQTQLLLEMGVPIETADVLLGTENGSLRGSNVAWTLDGLIDYLCVGGNVYVEFQKDFRLNFWICYYRRYEERRGLKFGVSKGGPTKIDAIFEVIYELHRNKYGTGTEKKEN